MLVLLFPIAYLYQISHAELFLAVSLNSTQEAALISCLIYLSGEITALEIDLYPYVAVHN